MTLSEGGEKYIPPEAQETSETQRLRKLFLNKWTMFLTLVSAAIALRSGFAAENEVEEQQAQAQEKFNLSEDDLPKDENEMQKSLDALGHLQGTVAKRLELKKRLSGEETEPAAKPEKDWKIKSIGDGKIVIRTVNPDGSETYTIKDLLAPKFQTATDENYQKLQEYFQENFQNYDFAIEREENGYEYTIKVKEKLAQGTEMEKYGIQVRVEEEGSYTVYPMSNFGEILNASSEEDLKEVIMLQLDIMELEIAWGRDKKYTDEEFKTALQILKQEI